MRKVTVKTRLLTTLLTKKKKKKQNCYQGCDVGTGEPKWKINEPKHDSQMFRKEKNKKKKKQKSSSPCRKKGLALSEGLFISKLSSWDETGKEKKSWQPNWFVTNVKTFEGKCDDTYGKNSQWWWVGLDGTGGGGRGSKKMTFFWTIDFALRKKFFFLPCFVSTFLKRVLFFAFWIIYASCWNRKRKKIVKVELQKNKK